MRYNEYGQGDVSYPENNVCAQMSLARRGEHPILHDFVYFLPLSHAKVGGTVSFCKRRCLFVSEAFSGALSPKFVLLLFEKMIVSNVLYNDFLMGIRVGRAQKILIEGWRPSSKNIWIFFSLVGLPERSYRTRTSQIPFPFWKIDHFIKETFPTFAFRQRFSENQQKLA